ncbi:MAG: hypothetical protein J6D54_08340 [Olsenella sp.]|nr:hypothetical protein [Olsenella sp.]
MSTRPIPIDYKTIFSKVLHEEIVRTFDEHGIEQIYEDELEDIIEECVRLAYKPSIREFNRVMGNPLTRHEYKLPPPSRRLIRIPKR